MAKVGFTKMHGQGNDFVMFDGVANALDSFTPDQARFLADRNRGVGADQVLLLSRDAGGEFGYRIWNADGGEVFQCGNGARAAHALLLLLGYSRGAVTLRTAAGAIGVDAGELGSRAYLAEPCFTPAGIPLVRSAALGHRHDLMWEGHELSFAALGLGNPHAVFWVADVDRAPVARLGFSLNAGPDFPTGVNVSFAERPAASVAYALRVYERGVGETQACGSGAAACAVVAHCEDGLTAIEVEVRGGKLRAGWAGPGTKAWVEGEVTHVFSGTVALP